ncbi:MAG: hypothetical protein H7288_22955 [Kineosporiaceae bacterium]|nr:hypothetical protein [Aeromicrobium sp.]
MQFAAHFTGPAVGDLAIEAFDGTRVGNSPEAFIAALPMESEAYFEKQDEVTRIYLGLLKV